MVGLEDVDFGPAKSYERPDGEEVAENVYERPDGEVVAAKSYERLDGEALDWLRVSEPKVRAELPPAGFFFELFLPPIVDWPNWYIVAVFGIEIKL